MAKGDVYQHFRLGERQFVERFLDRLTKVEKTFTFELTDFLDPRQVYIARTLINQHDLQLFVSSDYVESEYTRLIIAPPYYQLKLSDFQISLLEITYNHKFNTLTHSQILGAVLHQSGLKRALLGDILVGDKQAQIFVDRSMRDYLISTITRMARVSVSLNEVSLKDRLTEERLDTEELILVSSLRIDKVISEVLRLARSKVLVLLEKEQIKVNYKLTTKPSENLAVGDMVSVRGFGRFKVNADEGLTKQSKHKLRIQKISRNHN